MRETYQILLMIGLSIPPFARWQNLRNNLPLPPFFIHQFGNLLRDTLLLRIMVEDARAVLGARIWTLAVRGCGIMHLVEEFEELSVSDFRWVVCDLQGFGICSFCELSLLLSDKVKEG